jgi:Fur family ferric uptake transcriptional regulator
MHNLEKILEHNNIKPTAMRLLVLQFLLNKKSATSLTDVENYFDKSDRTTLYRTLKTFVEKGISHKIDDGTGITKYALCEENCHCEIDNDLHLHFHCTNCNETICVTDYKIPKITLPSGYIAENINLVVKGTCDKCNKK